MLRKLCESYTDLTDRDIRQLESLEANLQYTADLTGSDIFIDCMMNGGSGALVVAEAKPGSSPSAYITAVVGKAALRENEPAVFRAFATGVPVRDIKAITQENVAVKQDVAPVKNPEGKVIGVLIREKDISAYVRQDKKYEELIRTVESRTDTLGALQTEDSKEAALREIHHRVKNNLQMVASILNMQARNSSIPEVRKAFKENVGRVLSIASIHDILMTTGGEDAVSIRCLADKLRRNIQSIAPQDKELVITVEGDDFVLPAEMASAVGLCISELISNAVEHGFGGRDKGHITVTIQNGNLYHSVSVRDDGIGFYPGARSKSSLGLNIVEATVKEKLKGEFRISSGTGGTCAMIEFRRDLDRDAPV